MTVAQPRSFEDALAALAADPTAAVLAGGTDLMVDVNFGRRRPSAVIATRNVPELRGWSRDRDEVVLRAGLTYTEMLAEPLATLVPALAAAARTVGSPQIRNAGTVGGNLATASPAGDTLPVLAALNAHIVVESLAGARTLALDELIVGPKRTSLRPGELIREVRVPVLRGPQEFLKVGGRNAMVIAVSSAALVVDLDGRAVRCALGSVGPVPIRARDAESWVAAHIDWDRRTIDDETTFETFGARVADAAQAIDDHRSSAVYRRHSIAVLARRALRRTFAGGARS